MLSESRYRKKLSIRIGRRWAILNLTKLIFFMVYPYLKLHILFNSNGLAIWSGFPDITHIKNSGLCCHDLVSVRILPNFELVRTISEVDIFFYILERYIKNVE